MDRCGRVLAGGVGRCAFGRGHMGACGTLPSPRPEWADTPLRDRQFTTECGCNTYPCVHTGCDCDGTFHHPGEHCPNQTEVSLALVTLMRAGWTPLPPEQQRALIEQRDRFQQVVDWAIDAGLVMNAPPAGDGTGDTWSGGELWPSYPGNPDICMCGEIYCSGGPDCEDAKHVARGFHRKALAEYGHPVCVDCGTVPASLADEHGDHYCMPCHDREADLG